MFQRFLEALVRRLSEKGSSQLYVACLEAIRIVSREKAGLGAVTTEKALVILLNHAGLDMSCLGEENDSVTIQDVFGIDCRAFLLSLWWWWWWWWHHMMITITMIVLFSWQSKFRFASGKEFGFTGVHWLRTTPSPVTKNIGLGIGFCNILVTYRTFICVFWAIKCPKSSVWPGLCPEPYWGSLQ